MHNFFKNIFKNKIILNHAKTCEYCLGLGYYVGHNSDYRKSTYWCDCKKINGKYPNECVTIDSRWETSYHAVVKELTKNEIDNILHYEFNKVRLFLPQPNDIFEPFLKLYLHNGKDYIRRFGFKKKLDHNGITIKWDYLDSFDDNKTIKELNLYNYENR